MTPNPVRPFWFPLLQAGSAVPPDIGDGGAVLAVGYLLHHRKASTTTAKSFELTTKSPAPGERMAIARSHSFKPITTRRYYRGVHPIELQVNGHRLGYAEFQLGD